MCIRDRYAVAALNGNGYKNPSRSKGLDFEGRMSFAPTEQTVIGIGAYSGTLGKEKQTVSALHTANRVDFLAAYMSGNTRFGVEYFQANNWNNVTSVSSDKASGWSLWGSVGSVSYTHLDVYKRQVRNTSRMVEAINGITMIDSTRPEVSMPAPIGGPRNSAPITGSGPMCSSSHGIMLSRITGISTKKPLSLIHI